MSNPGPAITSTTHPSNLNSQQALRVIAVQKGLSVAALGDTAVQVNNSALYVPATVVIANGVGPTGLAVDVSSVYIGVYTAKAELGNAVLTAAALTSNTGAPYVTVSATSTPHTAETAQTLYFNVSSATAAATVDVYVYGYDLSSGPY
jgi:hypothetical protein